MTLPFANTQKVLVHEIFLMALNIFSTSATRQFFSNLRANFFRPRVSGPVFSVEDVNENLHSA